MLKMTNPDTRKNLTTEDNVRDYLLSNRQLARRLHQIKRRLLLDMAARNGNNSTMAQSNNTAKLIMKAPSTNHHRKCLDCLADDIEEAVSRLDENVDHASRSHLHHHHHSCVSPLSADGDLIESNFHNYNQDT